MRREGIWVVPAGPTDEVGDPVLDEDGHPVLSGAPWYWAECDVWPRSSTEDADGGVRIISGFNVWMRGDPPEISATDDVLVRSRTYEVDGVPGRYPSKGVRLVLSILGIA